ncbi:unnamed protein product [Auanema sp. JU1783]|nr:unnamed protein product [Auanema sp. JU1783]
MPRVRLRTSESLSRSNNVFARFLNWMTGGEHWTHHHASVFVLTFFSFAFIHATRKTLSTVKPSMIAIWTQNTTASGPLFPSAQAASEFLAYLDGGFLFAYSIGLFVGGMLGDRYDPRSVLSIGMWLSAIATFLFGYVTEIFGVYSKIIYSVLWIASGIFQSVAWPTEVCIMGNWFGHHSRGTVMGIWSACASAGNIIGTLISSQMVLIGYEYAFAANSLILFVFAFLVYWNLASAPRDVGLPDTAEFPDEMNRVIEVRSDDPTARPSPIGFQRACCLPGVLPYSLAYACLKLVNYGFFFWLPFYLHNRFGWKESDADALSTWYDVGGIFAAVLAGAVSDHFSSRTPLVVSMLSLSTFALYAVSNSPPTFFANAVLLAVAGFFIGGPANMISSSVSADLGRARELRGNAEALATVTGIVDGTGSLGASLGQLVIPPIQQWYGWNTIFYCFIVMIVATCLFLTPLLIKECLKRRQMHYSNLSSEEDEEAEGLLQDEEQNVRRRVLPDIDSD